MRLSTSSSGGLPLGVLPSGWRHWISKKILFACAVLVRADLTFSQSTRHALRVVLHAASPGRGGVPMGNVWSAPCVASVRYPASLPEDLTTS